MEAFTTLLIAWGGWGLFVAGFISGSILPFSSEVVLAVLLHMGIDPLTAITAATLGNTLGGMSCYWIGSMGKAEWILRLGVTEEKLDKAKRFLAGRGALMGFFAFLPGIGEAVAIALGLMRSNFWLTSGAMLAGKALRYVAILLAYRGVISFF